MLPRRMATAFKQQNWVAFLLDVIIVIAGVYVAVIIGQWDIKQRDIAQAHQSLSYLHQDLKDDIGQINHILKQRENMSDALAALIDSLKQSPLDKQRVTANAQALSGIDTPTFFPNQSVYTLMLANGQLTNIGDKALVRQLTKLYDYSNNRNDVYAYLSDLNHDGILRQRHQFFDSSTQTLLTENAVEIGKFRSGLYGQKAYGDDYSTFLKSVILRLYIDLDQSLTRYSEKHMDN